VPFVVVSAASTSTRPTAPWCWAWTRKAKFKRWTAPHRCCPCAPDRSNAALRRGQWPRAGTTASSSSLSRVPPISRYHRTECACGTGRTSHPGQLRHAQDATDPPLAGQTSPLPPALHSTSASWLNLVERWFAELTEKQIRRGVHRSTLQLENAIRHFIDHHNRNPKPFVWTKSADQILDSVARFCKRTLDSGH